MSSEILEKLIKKYIPFSGKTGTTGGEILRAYQRIHYRFFNDGDMFSIGYGRETCGSSAIFIFNYLKEFEGYSEDFGTEKFKDEISNKVLRYMYEMELNPYELNRKEAEKYYKDNLEKLGEFLERLFTEVPKLFERAMSADSRDCYEREAKNAWGDWEKGIDYSKGILKESGSLIGFDGCHHPTSYAEKVNEIKLSDLEEDVRDTLAVWLAVNGVNPKEDLKIADIDLDNITDNEE